MVNFTPWHGCCYSRGMKTKIKDTTTIGTFTLIPLMPLDRDYNQNWLTTDGDEIEYAVEVDQQIRTSRKIYNFAEEESGRPVTPAVAHPDLELGEHAACHPAPADVPTPEAAPPESDLELLTLDLGELEDEYSQFVERQGGAPVIKQEEGAGMGDLDLYGLFDGDEPSSALEDKKACGATEALDEVADQEADEEVSASPEREDGIADLESDEGDLVTHEVDAEDPAGQEEDEEYDDQVEDADAIDSADGEFEADNIDHLESLLPENDDGEDDTFWNDGSVHSDSDTKEEPTIDWLAGELDNEEFDGDIEPDVEYEVDIASGVSREQRALQAAICTGVQFRLDGDAVGILAEIYLANGWSACRVSIERELDAGAEVEELELAAAIKELWLEHYEFYAGMSSNYKIMSWPTALAIVRSFDGYPSLEEVELLLEQLHDHWYSDSVARRIHRSFGQYVIAWFHGCDEHGVFAGEWNIRLATFVDDQNTLPPSTEHVLVATPRGAPAKKLLLP